MVDYPDNSIKFATKAELNPHGRVRSADRIREDRRQKGYCDTCGIEPVRCYEIKKTWGGTKREKVPLTKPGKVFEGICLDCHGDMDPDGGRHKRHSGHDGRQHHHHHCSHTGHHQAQDPHAALAADRREIRQLPHAMNGEVTHGERTNSFPNVGLGRGPVRQAGFRNFRHAASLPTNMEHLDSMDHLQLVDGRGPVRQAGFRNFRHATSLPITMDHLDSMDHLQLVDEQEPVEQEPECVEKIKYNIFNEPVLVKKKKSWSRKNANNAPSSPTRSNNGGASSPRKSPHRQSHPRAEKKVDEQAEHLDYPNLPQQSPPLPTGRNVYGNHHSPPHRQNSGHHRSSRDRARQMEEQKLPSLPSLPKHDSSNATNQSKSSGDDEPLDALALLCAQYRETNPEETVKFVPGSQEVLPHSELHLSLSNMPDDFSTMTLDACFQGRGSMESTMEPTD